MDADLSALRNLACDLAVEAGNVLVTERNRARTKVTTKANPNDFVSAADLASEQLIVDGLLAVRPEDGILGEEGGTRTGSNAYRWVIDPLDGTRNYVDGCGPYAVSIALEHHGVPVVGVIRDPVFGNTYSAIRGEGAFRNGEQIQASSRTRLNESIVGLSLLPEDIGRTTALRALQLLMSQMGDFRRLGSAVTQLALVASGEMDATISMGVKRWDVAAGIVIAQEAGASVVGLNGGAPDERLTIAAGAAIIEELRSCLAEVANP